MMTRHGGQANDDPYAYVVSFDKKCGMWYAHMRGFPYIPVFGSMSESKSRALAVMRERNSTKGMA